MTIFRWVSPTNNAVVNLDLNALATGATEGFRVSDLDLGIVPVNSTLLSQSPYPGAIQAGIQRGVTQMSFRLKVRAATRDALTNLFASLRAELVRSPGCIEFRPKDQTSSVFIDTLASDLPSSYLGEIAPMYGPGYVEISRTAPIIVRRQPDFRGAALIL